MKFAKYQANGNDFLLIDIHEPNEKMLSQLSQRWCHRHFGIGADGLLAIYKKGNDTHVSIWNSDGSEASFCGNGLRCVAGYLKNKGMTSIPQIFTKSGPHSIEFKDQTIRIEIGKPHSQYLFPQQVGGIRYTFVSVGNFHAIGLVEDIDEYNIEAIAKVLQSQFDVNVSLVQVLGRDSFKQIIFERGAGATLSCGSAAAAAFYALYQGGYCEAKTTVHQPGGSLTVEIVPSGYVFIEGPAEKVFDGEITDAI